MLKGKARAMGLGPYPVVSLADARIKALECKKLMLDGSDPIEVRNAKQSQQRIEETKSVTFSHCAASYIDSHRAGWKNAKHADQWKNTISTYAIPIIGGLPVQAVDTALVMKVLEPIWREKTETANRLRNRIELILGWATAREFRTGDNPARWRGHLDKLLPKRSTIQPTEHHAALPVDKIGAFIKDLRACEGVAPRALEFLILTATRTGEAIATRWDEIDFDQALWTIPATRMKGKKEHRVPLSATALTILQILKGKASSEYVFTNVKGNRHLSNMALLEVLRRMEMEVTTHGFRSTFRDWAAERTNYPREVAEMALAHVIENKVEAAYRRGDLFEKRRRLMNEWTKFCSQPSVINKNVVGIRNRSQNAVAIQG
jgi:integrase